MDTKNKKRLYLAAMALSGALSLSGCSYGDYMDEREKNSYFRDLDVNYSNESGLNYEAVSKFYITFLSNTDNAYMIVIHGSASDRYDYFSGNKIFSFENMYADRYAEPIVAVDYDICYFIEKYAFNKERYTDEDLKKLLSMIKRDYELKLDEKYDGSLSDHYKLVLKKENKR